MSNNRERSTATTTTKEADIVRLKTGGSVAFGDRTRARSGSQDSEFNLSVPEGTIPADMVGHWFQDGERGEIDRALAGWWGFVQDSRGVNITRSSGSRKMVLMAKMKEHHDQDADLQMKRYRASIGEDADKPLGDGVESYTPNGESNKIKVTSDPFSS